jgi:hypothetical protein
MILFIHLSTSLVNCILVAWHSLILEGDISAAAAPALALP